MIVDQWTAVDCTMARGTMNDLYANKNMPCITIARCGVNDSDVFFKLFLFRFVLAILTYYLDTSTSSKKKKKKQQKTKNELYANKVSYAALKNIKNTLK